MNLLIFLHLTYKPCKNFKFFLIFTYNQGKVFLILPITRGGHMYTWSPLGVAPLNLLQTFLEKYEYCDHLCEDQDIPGKPEKRVCDPYDLGTTSIPTFVTQMANGHFFFNPLPPPPLLKTAIPKWENFPTF